MRLKKINLIDRSNGMVVKWRKHFYSEKDVSIHCGNIFDFKTDCIVSPANSFGFMDGGLDLAISKQYGWHIEEKLQDVIREKYNGELLVGQAELIETENNNMPYIISAPTMRVPMILKDTVNVYLAMKAILRLFKQDDRLQTIFICGLGTGVGQMPFDICARQMKQAYDEVWLQKVIFPESWMVAQERHQLLYSNEIRDLQSHLK